MGIGKSDPIIIVGAGAFGLSTAYHLALAGYTDISVYDKHEQIPPEESAANDINKILRAEYEDPFYTDLTLEAIRAWKTPLFAPHFHQTGFLHCVSDEAPPRAVETLKRFQHAAESHPALARHVVPIRGGADVEDNVWQYKQAHCAGWTGYLNKFDGYVHSGNALVALYRATQTRGVKYFLGKHGGVAEIVYEETTPSGGSSSSSIRRATGIRTHEGRHVRASLVVVAVGASAARLVPECGAQVVAKSWSVAHVLLTADEASALRGIPVTYARDFGFFFEPDPDTRLLKVCPMGGGYVNTDPATGVSLPPPSRAESAFMPPGDQQKVRRLLAATLPWLRDRPLVRQSLCWFADTSGSDFIVDYVPGSAASVVLVSGDSGHAGKLIPLVGGWVRSLLEAPDGRQPVDKWRWKETEAKDGGGWGDAVSWRLGNTMEFAELQNPKAAKL
ncbi:L-saccharopine oxidase [Colletotrichum orbiculare MAFF 240422]|uniref:L-saccharopine oxidase n=1 Tax=Colletotrichum orbiculare (strain 104-T / ATCC 96160 / CBS 514.97 / LARS 414 / MAFF 240422) TaxID=1213857 RepID=N4UVY6_COLOR|nr:L-saccharopine oxidase [Colletotrichum orbiculare MAFF 240422]